MCSRVLNGYCILDSSNKDLTFVTLMFVCTSEQGAGRPGALNNKSPTGSSTLKQPHYSQQILLLKAGQFTIASKQWYIGKKIIFGKGRLD